MHRFSAFGRQLEQRRGDVGIYRHQILDVLLDEQTGRRDGAARYDQHIGGRQGHVVLVTFLLDGTGQIELLVVGIAAGVAPDQHYLVRSGIVGQPARGGDRLKGGHPRRQRHGAGMAHLSLDVDHAPGGVVDAHGRAGAQQRL